jgi:leucyl aminopeptidase
LIGKSITFDSGGLSLKPSEAMEWMKIDMAGGAAVLGVFKFLSLLAARGWEDRLNVNVFGILPACENMPSGKALRPGDILTALNGKTIEVLNTDAEGRLTLADALSYAEKFIKPDYCVDLATLTGACMVALGEDIAGLFGNDNQLIKKFETVAKKENEELWQLPLPSWYRKLIQSDIADIKNIGGRYGGAITAALFLKEFVEKMKWIHLDIAGPAFNQREERGIIKKGATGWGVISLIEFLRNEN